MFTNTTMTADPVQHRSLRRIARWFRPVSRHPVRVEYRAPVAPRRSMPGSAVAVLFDADNIPPAKAGAILASARQLGPLRIVRAYGDFFQTHLAGWRHAMTAHAISGRQVTTVARGKDTVDHAIVADAIALAHTTEVTTVVIASSDSDFVDLAVQLRELGCSVHGYGERKAHSAMIAACDRFVYLEDLPTPTATAPAPKTPAAAKAAAKTPAKPMAAAAKTGTCAELPDAVAAALCEVVNGLAKSPHGADLAAVCLRMHAKGITAELPENARNKPGRFLKECGLFDVQEVKQQAGRSTHTYLRTKPSHPSH